jgi:hypothetical protein
VLGLDRLESLPGGSHTERQAQNQDTAAREPGKQASQSLLDRVAFPSVPDGVR